MSPPVYVELTENKRQPLLQVNLVQGYRFVLRLCENGAASHHPAKPGSLGPARLSQFSWPTRVASLAKVVLQSFSECSLRYTRSGCKSTPGEGYKEPQWSDYQPRKFGRVPKRLLRVAPKEIRVVPTRSHFRSPASGLPTAGSTTDKRAFFGTTLPVVKGASGSTNYKGPTPACGGLATVAASHDTTGLGLSK